MVWRVSVELVASFMRVDYWVVVGGPEDNGSRAFLCMIRGIISRYPARGGNASQKPGC